MKNDFESLTPELIIKTVEAFGFEPQNHFYQLNSYENRVFEVFLENSKERLILKAYRPRRWSLDCINEEHSFLLELEANGIDVIAPVKSKSGPTVLKQGDFFMSLFKKAQGRMPQEFLTGDLVKVGSTLARIHNVGATKKNHFRPTLDALTYGWQPLENVMSLVPSSISSQYEDVCIDLLEEYEYISDSLKFIRIHGDCHKGNLLHDGAHFFFVDFDDYITGPEAQDLWMLLDSFGDQGQIDELKEGYSSLRHWPENQIEIFPLLKALRIISYASWLATRWPNDPSFQRAFPNFATEGYWWNELQFLQKIHQDYFE